MIILLDANVWDKLVEPYFNGTPKSGTLIFQGHLHDSQFLHWAKDIGGQKLLGRVELKYLIRDEIDRIGERYIKLTGFPSREGLKRNFLMFSEKTKLITVAEMRIIEAEKYWCPKCFSVNLDFLKKNIFADQLPFGCFDCNEEFYTPDKDEGNARVKIAKLEKRYCKEQIKKIPANQQTVLAIAGEEWKLY